MCKINGQSFVKAIKHNPKIAIGISVGVVLFLLIIVVSFLPGNQQKTKHELWKTFRSEEKGYTFRYRSDYVILHENGYGVTLDTAGKENKVVTMTISHNPADMLSLTTYPSCPSQPQEIVTPCIYRNWVVDQKARIATGMGDAFFMTFAKRDPDTNQLINYYVIQTKEHLLLHIAISLAPFSPQDTVINPFFQDVLSSFSFITTPKTVLNSDSFMHYATGKYSILVPAAWTIVKPLHPNDPTGFMSFDPEDETGIHLNGITIRMQPASPEDTNWHDRYANDSFSQRIVTHTTVAGYPALVKYQFHKVQPVTAPAIDWYNGPDKETVVAVGNNTVVIFQAKWDKAKPYYESQMDAIVNSLQIQK